MASSLQVIALLHIFIAHTEAAVVKRSQASKSTLLRGATVKRTCHLSADGHGERRLCTQNNVSVIESERDDGLRVRSLQFGDECAVESQVVCKWSQEVCDQSCNLPCPCDVDASFALSVPYMQTMFEQLGPVCLQGSSRVLLLGLGGGELSQYLLHHCSGMQVDAVELNADVISLARSYFGLSQYEHKFKGQLNIEQNDGLNAVKAHIKAGGQDTYDAVLVDCFVSGGEVPESCRSRELASNVKMVLKPGGSLLQNIWHFSNMKSQVAEQYLETKAIYKDVFDGLLEDFPVPMPPRIRWVDILKAQKQSA